MEDIKKYALTASYPNLYKPTQVCHREASLVLPYFYYLSMTCLWFLRTTLAYSLVIRLSMPPDPLYKRLKKPDLDEASKWVKDNKMKIHQSKTKYIISTAQKLAKSPTQSLDLTLDGQQISKTASERVLGVYIDSHLTWSVHIEELRRKLIKRMSILARVRKHLPTQYRLLLFNANIKPLFEYCCTV